MEKQGRGNGGRGNGGRGTGGWSSGCGDGGGRGSGLQQDGHAFLVFDSSAGGVDSLACNLRRMNISPSIPASHSPSNKGKLVPINRNEEMVLYHYDVDVMLENPPEGRPAPQISKSDVSAFKIKLFRVNAEHSHVRAVAYDGHRNLFSRVIYHDGEYRVVLRGNAFRVTLKLVKPVPLMELMQSPCSREILQGLDMLMKDNSRVDVENVMYFV